MTPLDLRVGPILDFVLPSAPPGADGAPELLVVVFVLLGRLGLPLSPCKGAYGFQPLALRLAQNRLGIGPLRLRDRRTTCLYVTWSCLHVGLGGPSSRLLEPK